MSARSNKRTKTTVADARLTYDNAIDSVTDLLRCKQLQDDLKGLLERANAKAVELGGGEDDATNVASMSNNDMKQSRMKNGQCADCGLQTHEVKTVPLTNKNVESGRCLLCHPVPSTIKAAVKKEEDASTVSRAVSPPPPLVEVGKSTGNAVVFEEKRFLDGEVWGDYFGELSENGLRHGMGKITWEDGKVYDGQWENDKKEGKGTLRFANGEMYEGKFKANKRHGQGTYRWPNGDMYEGEYKNGMRDGWGTYRLADGRRYEGEYKAGKHHGRGTYHWEDGEVHIGQWKDNKCCGKGVRWSADRKTSWLLKDGNVVVRKISLDEAKALALEMGFSGVPCEREN